MNECLPENNGIQSYIRDKAALIESRLRHVFPQDWEIPAILKQSMDYSLFAGGKRLRPVFVLAACESVGGSEEAAVHAACALEMIHTYSLIHDDLPCMDNDEYRRGKLTNHMVYGEAMALLAGDGLLTHAFYQIAQAARYEQVSAEQIILLIEEVSVLAGAAGMVGGQAADMLGDQGKTVLAELEYIHRHKTADLIIAALKTGGRIGSANESQLAALHTFGLHIGLAFQIQDDILDVIGDERKMGKKVNSDSASNKVTYPYVLGLEASKRKVDEMTEEAKSALLRSDIDKPEKLLELADLLMKRDH